jgi:predicted dehydrogenase
MSMLRIGIVGAARVATYAMLAPAAANPRASVVAVAARDGERARAYAATHGIARAHEGYAALIADPDVDLVYVALPPAMHAAVALDAIAAGKPVLVEKPFAMDAAEAARVLDAAEAAGVPVFEAMHARHHALHARLRTLVAEIGPVTEAHAVFDIPAPGADDFRWRRDLGGGALMDLGIYPLAWLRHQFGEAFEVTDAMMLGLEVDWETRATLQFAGGPEATVACDMGAARFAASLHVYGEGGAIEVINPLAPQMGCRLTVNGRKQAVTGPGTFAAQLDALCATLLDGAPFPLPPRDPEASMRAIDAVRAAGSAARGGGSPP